MKETPDDFSAEHLPPYKQEFFDAISAKLGNRLGAKFQFPDGRTATLFRMGKMAMIGIHEAKGDVETTRQYGLTTGGNIEYTISDWPLVNGVPQRGGGGNIEKLVRSKMAQHDMDMTAVSEDEIRALTIQIGFLGGPIED